MRKAPGFDVFGKLIDIAGLPMLAFFVLMYALKSLVLAFEMDVARV
jgi:hypothetical protein